MLKITGLTKEYPRASRLALNNFSLEVGAGEIFGLVGANGAGKTTLIRCITGILPYNIGRIEVCGMDLIKRPLEAKNEIGFVSDDHSVFESLTCREYINLIADIYKVSEKDRKARAEEMLNMFSLREFYDKSIFSYSHGMKQKTAVMGALIHRPKLWILDEPLIGLDPKSIYLLKQAILKYKSEGNTVIFSTHLLDVAEKLCDRVGLISQGNLCGVYDMKELRQSGTALEDIFVSFT